MLALAFPLDACSRSAPGATAESAAAAPLLAISRDQAIQGARQFISRSPAASAVYLDSVQVAEAEATWHVMFRRRALIAPTVVTVDVDRRTGAMRFPGDE
jgi:hypothetical protein